MRDVRWWIDANPDTCIYCGDGEDGRDHLIPRGWSGEGVRRIVPTVPACTSCNSTINDVAIFTIDGRAREIADKLNRRHKKELAKPDHPVEWYADLTGNLRKSLLAAQYNRSRLRTRLHVLSAGGAPTFGLTRVGPVDRQNANGGRYRRGRLD